MLKRPHVAVSPDQRIFARDRGFQGIAFWRLAEDDGPPFAQAELHLSGVAGMQFDASGRLIVVTRDAELHIWDVSSLPDEPQSLFEVRLPSRRVVATAFSDDRAHLAVGDEAGAITLVDLRADEPIVARREAHADKIVALAFSNDGEKLASSGRDRVVRVWSTALEVRRGDAEHEGQPDGDSASSKTFNRLHELHGMEGWSVTMAFDSQGKRLVAGAMDNGVYLFDLSGDGKLTNVHYVHFGWVADVAWSPDDAVIMTGSWDTTVGLFDAADLTPQVAFEVHRDYVVDVRFLPGTDLVVSSSYDRSAVVWNWRERRAVAQLDQHGDWVHFAIPLDGGRVITVCSDGTARVWDSGDWSIARSLGKSVSDEVDVGAVDMSQYVGSPTAESRRLDGPARPSAQPKVRVRDMRTTTVGGGTGQTAMALLQSALEDAPGVNEFVSGAAVAVPASMQEATFDPDLSDADAVSTPVSDVDSKPLDAAAAFEGLDLGGSAMDAPQIEVDEVEIDLPDETVEPSLADVLDAEPHDAGDSMAASPAEITNHDVDLPDLDLSADPAALTSESGDESSDPSTLEMSPSMLEDLADIGDTESSAMRSGTSLDPFGEEIELEESPTADGVPNVDLEADLPQVDDAWADIGDDVLEYEEGGIDAIEPAVDLTGPHSAVSEEELETAEAPRPLGNESSQSSAQTPERGTYSTMPGRPPVDETDHGGEASPALSSAPFIQGDEPDDAFTPRFLDAAQSDAEEAADAESEAGIGGESNTVSYHEAAAGDGAFGSAPGSTQQLHNVTANDEPGASDQSESSKRPRSSTAVGTDLSEDSTFDFFFGQQATEGPSDRDDTDDSESQSTSRLVPEQHFTGDFGKSPDVFDTTVEEIWAARPETRDTMMGIVKKPRTAQREYDSAFAIRTYHQWVYSVAIAPNGSAIASCGGNNLVCVWSKTGDLLHQLRASSSGFNEVKFSPDSLTVVAAGDDGGIHIWMLPTEEYGRIRHAVLNGHDGVVSSIAFTADSRYMLSGSFDGTARVWDMSDGRCRVVLDDHEGPVADVAIASRRAFTVGHDGTVRIWDDRKWMIVDVFDGFDKLLSVSSNGVVHAWTAANGDAFYAEDGHPRGLLQHRGEARGVCVTEAGMVVTAGQDAQLRVYHQGSTDPTQSIMAPAALWSLDVHDGFIAAGGDDGKIHIFRA